MAVLGGFMGTWPLPRSMIRYDHGSSARVRVDASGGSEGDHRGRGGEGGPDPASARGRDVSTLRSALVRELGPAADRLPKEVALDAVIRSGPTAPADRDVVARYLEGMIEALADAVPDEGEAQPDLTVGVGPGPPGPVMRFKAAGIDDPPPLVRRHRQLLPPLLDPRPARAEGDRRGRPTDGSLRLASPAGDGVAVVTLLSFPGDR